jgi:predicted Rossmann-fold nucleotide-binding protein
LLLNIDGYFDLLIQMIAHSVAEGYIRQVDADLVRVTTNVAEVIPILQESPRQEHRSKYMDIDKT